MAKTLQILHEELIQAIGDGDLDACRALVKAGVNLGQETDGTTPLYEAVSCRKKDICKYFIEMGANVNQGEKTPLHAAAELGETELCELLLDAGANVDAKVAVVGHTPLHLACFTVAAFDPALLLLKRGANVRARDEQDNEPLHIASKWETIEFCRGLLEHGARIDARNQNNHTPLDTCDRETREELIRINQEVLRKAAIKIIRKQPITPTGSPTTKEEPLTM